MTSVVRAEWVRLLRARTIVALGLPLVLVPALVTVFAFAAGTGRPGPGPASHITVSGSDLVAWDGYLTGLRSASSTVGALVLVFVAVSLGTDYAHATLGNLLLRQPNRVLLITGKLAAALSVVAVACAFAVGVAIVAAWISAAVYDVSTSDWTTVAREGVASWVALAVAAVAWAAVGAALVTVLRSTSAAIAVGVVWALPVEASLSAAWDGVDRWLPGAVFSAFANRGTASLGFASAAALTALYAGVA